MDYLNHCMEYIQDMAQNCQEVMECLKQDIFIDKVQRMAEDILDQEEDNMFQTNR